MHLQAGEAFYTAVVRLLQCAGLEADGDASALTGLLKVYHTLDVRDADSRNHCAEMQVLYLYTVKADAELEHAKKVLGCTVKTDASTFATPQPLCALTMLPVPLRIPPGIKQILHMSPRHDE